MSVRNNVGRFILLELLPAATDVIVTLRFLITKVPQAVKKAPSANLCSLLITIIRS